MRDLWRAIFSVAELEQHPKGLTLDQLHRRLAESDLNPPVIRTLQREIEYLRQLGFNLLQRGHRYILPAGADNLYAFLQLVKLYSESSSGAPYFYGVIDARRLCNYFAQYGGVITLIYQLLSAIKDRHFVAFDYTPQSDLTWQKILARAKHQSTNSRVIPVRLLPHFLVSGGNSFLVLGEYYEKRALFGKYYKDPKVRHYELCGIDKLTLCEAGQSALRIDPEEIYRHSVHIWSGGKIYEVELEELWSEGGKPRRRRRKVNGEDEILSLAASSLGRIKIVNPPEELHARARALGLPESLVFRFER